ncbi:MAG: bifunctional 5,10-methylenetetrahydrofolate dehydrogenase/5,10-methenyltetrahydrofolate cyclohydrolase [Patescibacteria group bacterium]|nr:bifunctional 5,10-methylenetetrahydrofolate dehydrogenase/5,10-methenyltetrahydrofolate cyclohydrolase [Patescibacteria group bacterium]MCL5262206.1 bifunctional 5,10-methylenetetrahydrofolate dehydrogenase/5,10-methenyltetrahydrofolate cyclohydrolase [Patescibacteria group bacterium]
MLILMIALSGFQISRRIYDRIRGFAPVDKFLAAILVGDNPASMSFIRKQKQQAAEKSGIDFRVFEFPKKVKEEELLSAIKALAEDEKCGGIIVQLPLPEHLDKQAILDAVPFRKDPDALSSEAINRFRGGSPLVLPPAVGVVKEILDFQKIDLKGKSVAVVGLGFLVGGPVADWFRGRCRELFLIDKGDDFSPVKNADIVVLGTGVPGLIKESDAKLGALVIDFGYGKDENGKLRGDFKPSATQNPAEAGFYTPTPGGTGPILVARLLLNFCELVLRSR